MQFAGERARHRQVVAEYGRGEQAKADYKVMLAAADEGIEAELSGLHARNTAGVLPSHGMLEEVWETSSIYWKRKVIRLAVERIEVHPSALRAAPGTGAGSSRMTSPTAGVTERCPGG